MTETKHCNICDRTLSINKFNIDRKTPDGHNHYCKDCCNEKAKNYRETPRGVYTTIKGRQDYHHRNNGNPAKPFNIEMDEFVEWYEAQERKCVYCDIPEEYIPLMAEKYGSNWNRLTIDCKDNDIGYRIDNLVLACAKCNITKSNLFTYEEWYEIAQKYMKPKWQALIDKLL